MRSPPKPRSGERWDKRRSERAGTAARHRRLDALLNPGQSPGPLSIVRPSPRTPRLARYAFIHGGSHVLMRGVISPRGRSRSADEGEQELISDFVGGVAKRPRVTANRSTIMAIIEGA